MRINADQPNNYIRNTGPMISVYTNRLESFELELLSLDTACDFEPVNLLANNRLSQQDTVVKMHIQL